MARVPVMIVRPAPSTTLTTWNRPSVSSGASEPGSSSKGLSELDRANGVGGVDVGRPRPRDHGCCQDSTHDRREAKGLLKATRTTHALKDSVSDASRLLDLDGLAVDRVESDAFEGRVVHVVTADECASACPGCGVFSISVKGRVCTRPRDIPYGAKRLRLIWHKRRWRSTSMWPTRKSSWTA